ncbi:radical SAM protein [Desulfonatronum lacustre]|uniref:radical SAM protein n=1 Tax=Desulfonatronum lacustre TaxID=66849 RepID=UPI0004B7B779|nr:radical SAM protein [Desulfonatronum lacustre]
MANAFGWLEVHAVDHCNHNCRWCHNYSPFAASREYEAKEYFDGLDVLKKNDIHYHSLSIMGGEPFLHQDLTGFAYALLERYRKPLMLTTNGFWLSLEDIRLYKDLWLVINTLRVSRYPTIMRRLGGEQVVSKLLNKIREINPNICIDFCDKAVFNKLEFWNSPEQPQLYCGNVECTALLSDMRMGRCGAGAYTRFAPKGMIPDAFLASKDMIYDLKQFNRDSFWFWRKRYPLDACSYCNFSQKLRSGPWKVEPGRKPFNESLEQQYHIHAAAIMLNRGDVLESENRLRYIENNYDISKEYSNLAGLIKFQKGEYQDANLLFRQALSQDQEYLPALRNLKVLLRTNTTNLKSV